MSQAATSSSKRFYSALWRWHFYAGLYVFLFLVMLAATGILMLVSGPLEDVQYRSLYFVTPGEELLRPSEQLAAVTEAYPHADAALYVPPPAEDRSSQFAILSHASSAAGHAGHWELPTISVFVDPFTGEILGELDPDDTLYNTILKIHGTLLMGDVGDYLIEIAAGFAVLLIVSGLYMWWPRADRRRRETIQQPTGRGRERRFWRNLHVQIGSWTSVVLLFFLLSGLTWTQIWGERFTQLWSTLPGEQFQAPLSAETHDSLNMAAHHDVPWSVEQTPLPKSGSTAGTPGIRAVDGIDLDSVVRYAYNTGFTTFRVAIPNLETQVWTVAAVTQSGDISDPRRDRIVHIDRETGNVLADISFQDYSLLGKVMAASIPLHQGDIGVLNLVVNGLFCGAFIVLAWSGVRMWWQRRRAGHVLLQPPPMPAEKRIWQATLLAMLALSLLFPLVAATLLGLFALDYCIVSRIRVLNTALK